MSQAQWEDLGFLQLEIEKSPGKELQTQMSLGARHMTEGTFVEDGGMWGTHTTSEGSVYRCQLTS